VAHDAQDLHDVVIVGAGPVGATLALALADANLDVVALDARSRGETLRTDRSLALSHGARLIYERLGIWSALCAKPHAVTPITAIDISQARGFGAMRIDAREQQLPALGYVVSYRALQAALDAALERSNVTLRYGERVTRIAGSPERARVSLGDASAPLDARLAVAADGAGALVEGIARKRRDYRQVALVARVWLDRPHHGLAYERFTAQGPLALLPEGDHYGLVWTQAPEQATMTLALSDAQFLHALAHCFGARVRGYARVADRRSFPLVLEYATPVVTLRTAAIGNAAQALHPIAGQGFNLGLRDAYELAAVIVGAKDLLGERVMLDRYRRLRAFDRRAGIAFTDSLVQLFEGAHLRWPRGIGLALLDALPPLKRAFTRTMLFGWR
jgi:2-octaprenyl-6-methoxyphenol hydroxylase